MRRKNHYGLLRGAKKELVQGRRLTLGSDTVNQQGTIHTCIELPGHAIWGETDAGALGHRSPCGLRILLPLRRLSEAVTHLPDPRPRTNPATRLKYRTALLQKSRLVRGFQQP